jgi:hypothetical protein
MKNEQGYVLVVTYSTTKITEGISSATKKLVEKTDQDVLRPTDTVESLSAAAKGSWRVLSKSQSQIPADAADCR